MHSVRASTEISEFNDFIASELLRQQDKSDQKQSIEKVQDELKALNARIDSVTNVLKKP